MAPFFGKTKLYNVNIQGIHQAEVEAKNAGEAIKKLLEEINSNSQLKATLVREVDSSPFPEKISVTELPDGKSEMYLARISKDGKLKELKKPKDEKEAKKAHDDMLTEKFADKLKEYW